MTLLSLGYVGLSAPDLSEWADFGRNLLGLELADESARTLAFRMDDRRARLHVAAGDGAPHFGWEVADAAALDAMAARLEAKGVAVHRADAGLAARRCVREMIWFLDPDGNRVELFHGAEIAAAPFTPGRAIAGFRTGALGLGHAVLTCVDLPAQLRFYTETLGFGVSDYCFSPFTAYFLHVNPRHHSLALVGTGVTGVHHLMMELQQFDDVGHGYDLAFDRREDIGVTLGRHSNDYMTSFYVRTPSNVLLEYGWGGRIIDPARWQAEELTVGPSIWGHERSWLSDEGRAVARAMRVRNAAEGLRRPLQYLPGAAVPSVPQASPSRIETPVPI